MNNNKNPEHQKMRFCQYDGCDKQIKYRIKFNVICKYKSVFFCYTHYWKCVKEKIEPISREITYTLLKDKSGYPCSYPIATINIVAEIHKRYTHNSWV